MRQGAAKKKKFYAIIGPRGKRIERTWDEAQRHIAGVAGVRHKSFVNRELAQSWLDSDGRRAGGITPQFPIAEERLGPGAWRAYAYVDGHHIKGTKVMGHGSHLHWCSERRSLSAAYVNNAGSNPTMEAMAIDHLLLRVSQAISKWPPEHQNQLRHLVVYSDCENVVEYAKKQRVPYRLGDIRYGTAFQTAIRSMLASERIAKGFIATIEYVQLPGHGGIEGNVVADNLAKDRCEIDEISDMPHHALFD